MDPNVSNLRVTPQVRFDQRGDVTQVTQYSFFLGKNGPFTLEYTAGKDTPEQVSADICALVAKLQAVGALPPSEAM